jgi:DNA invertase Pin-like site-specific DNA recombinase
VASKLTPVDGYIRVSRVGDRQGDRFISPELQRESIKRVCKQEGLRVVKWFEELDASGGDSTRPMWNEALDRVESGKTKGIVCWNLSRFSRSMRDALNALDRIEKAGGRVYSEEGNIGKLSRNILLAVAEDERERTKAVFRNINANAIARGVYIAAKIPFGYTRDLATRRLEPDPTTAPIVAELFQRRASGVSWSQLTRWLLDTHGIYRNKSTLFTMIKNPAYLGVARQGDLVNERAHKAIVTRKLWEEANAAKGRKPAHTGRSKSLILRGLVSCGNCGHSLLVGQTRGKIIEGNWKSGKRESLSTYACRNQACDAHAYANAAEADAIVSERVLGWLSKATVTFETVEPQQLTQAERDLEQAEEALERFRANKRAILILGDDSWNDLLAEYVMARNVAQTALDALRDDSQPKAELIPELWDEWTPESRREFLGNYLEAVTVEPAKRQRTPLSERLRIKINQPGDIYIEADGQAVDYGTLEEIRERLASR